MRLIRGWPDLVCMTTSPGTDPEELIDLWFELALHLYILGGYEVNLKVDPLLIYGIVNALVLGRVSSLLS